MNNYLRMYLNLKYSQILDTPKINLEASWSSNDGVKIHQPQRLLVQVVASDPQLQHRPRQMSIWESAWIDVARKTMDPSHSLQKVMRSEHRSNTSPNILHLDHFLNIVGWSFMIFHDLSISFHHASPGIWLYMNMIYLNINVCIYIYIYIYIDLNLTCWTPPK